MFYINYTLTDISSPLSMDYWERAWYNDEIGEGNDYEEI